jgi:hypothetical protein
MTLQDPIVTQFDIIPTRAPCFKKIHLTLGFLQVLSSLQILQPKYLRYVGILFCSANHIFPPAQAYHFRKLTSTKCFRINVPDYTASQSGGQYFARSIFLYCSQRASSVSARNNSVVWSDGIAFRTFIWLSFDTKILRVLQHETLNLARQIVTAVFTDHLQIVYDRLSQSLWMILSQAERLFWNGWMSARPSATSYCRVF